ALHGALALDRLMHFQLRVKEGDLPSNGSDVAGDAIVEKYRLVVFIRLLMNGVEDQIFEQGTGGLGRHYRMAVIKRGVRGAPVSVDGVTHLVRQSLKRLEVSH